ncbi:AraC family transcriptional regulator [Pantoea sp. ICBG 1758]|uniref:helix-turn-helix domain-containing protein n=1 Tax=unclassified Pantoea TaxID=2630326 RepID=UPI000CE3612A|nr:MULTISPECIES: AraC family transcriptional regulator [unclassified Pantoea]NIE70768.1 helix-turn-helix transcriptional regulator [Pantoea sp. Acro-807]PPC64658.1 AraC family transcriptional regulator [Pantoea sp. ICBG 1758]
MSDYQTFTMLKNRKAQLRDSVPLSGGIRLAAWFNSGDRVTNHSDHHTLSLYIEEGYDTWHKTAHGWRNGGAPDRFCLMPSGMESTWDLRADLAFVHLYCTDTHLRQLGEQIWDRTPASLNLQEKIFADDDRITQLYRHFLLSVSWQQPANQLMLSSASTLLLTHLLHRYSDVHWQLPAVRGGLAPAVLRRIIALIDAQLDQPLTLARLAAEAALSEYHFARMFRSSTGSAPHQYVMQRRMAVAKELLMHSTLPLTEIALRCGFHSASHFSNRFRQLHGVAPSAWRQDFSR